MSAGLYDKIIVIQRPTTIKNEYGEAETQYVDKYKVRGRIVHKSGSLGVSNDEILHSYTMTIEMYRFIDVKDTDYLVFDNHQWRVLDLDDSRERGNKTLVVEIVND
jgi:head-tail adaptor